SQQNMYLAALQETTLGLIRRLDLNSLLQDIMKRAGELVGTPHTFVFLLKPDAAAMVMRVASGVHRQSIGYRLRKGEGMAGRVWETGQTLVINDYANWAERMRNADYVETLHAMIGMPLKSGTQVVGVLGLAFTDAGRQFGENEIA